MSDKPVLMDTLMRRIAAADKLVAATSERAPVAALDMVSMIRARAIAKVNSDTVDGGDLFGAAIAVHVYEIVAEDLNTAYPQGDETPHVGRQVLAGHGMKVDGEGTCTGLGHLPATWQVVRELRRAGWNAHVDESSEAFQATVVVDADETVTFSVTNNGWSAIFEEDHRVYVPSGLELLPATADATEVAQKILTYIHHAALHGKDIRTGPAQCDQCPQ